MVYYHVIRFANKVRLNTKFAFQLGSGLLYSHKYYYSKSQALHSILCSCFQSYLATNGTHLEISSRFLLDWLLSFSFQVLFSFLCFADLLNGHSILKAYLVNALFRIKAPENKDESCFTKTLQLMGFDRMCVGILIEENHC